MSYLNTSDLHARTAVSAVALALSLATLASPALAQQADAGEGVSEGEIIVSARRRDERLQDVPAVVNAIPAEMIGKLNLQDSKELQALVPGLQLRSESNGIGGSGQLRGIQYDINSSADPSVAFYLNDAPIGANFMLGQMFDIGQVEVLRGPQGTLRGATVPSGSITYTTRKPSLSEVGASGSLSFSDAHHTNVNAAFSIPIIKDIFAVRVAGVYDTNRGNEVDTIVPISPTATFKTGQISHPKSETLAGRVLAVLEPTDWLKLEGMYQAQDLKSAGFDQYASFNLVDSTAPASPLLIRPDDFLSIQESPRRSHAKFKTYNWRAELRFVGQKLIYQGSHNTFVVNATANQDVANFRSGYDFYQDTFTSSKGYSHEVRLQNEAAVAGMFDYIVGFYRTQGTVDIRVTQEIPTVLPPFLGGSVVNTFPVPTANIADGPSRETAFFGNVTAHIGEKLNISAGVRHADYDVPTTVLTILGNPNPFNPGIDRKKWIYSGSIQYNFTPDLMVYANTGTSYRVGPSIFNNAVGKSPLQLSFLNLQPESSTSYEVGLKSSWLDNKLIFNVSLFHQKFENFPYKITNSVFFEDTALPSNVASVGNSAQYGASVPVTVKGIEGELSWRPSSRFNLGIVASYTDGQIKNGVVPCNDLNGDHVPDTSVATPTVAQLQAAYGANRIGSCTVNQRSAYQSPFSATVQAEYKMPVTDSIELFTRGLFTYYGSNKVDPTLAFDDLDSYGLLNLYAGLRAEDGAWEINLFARNVFDTVRASRFTLPQATSFQELQIPSFTTVGKTFTSTYSQVTTNLPREFGINLRFALGSR